MHTCANFYWSKTKPPARNVFFVSTTRGLRRFLPTCSPAQLAELFGPVRAFLVEDADPATLLEFTLADKKLVRRAVPVTREASPEDADKTRLGGIKQAQEA